MEEWLRIKLEKANEHIEKEEYNSAIGIFIESLELTEVNDELLQIRNSLAYLYQNLSEHKNAIKQYNEAFALIDSKKSKDALDLENMAHVNASIASSYMQINQLKEANKALRLAIDGYAQCDQESNSIKAFKAIAHFNLGSSYVSDKKWKLAKSELKDSLILHEELIQDGQADFLPYAANTNTTLAEVYEEMDDLYTAYVHLKKACDIFIQLSSSRPGMYLPYLAANYNNLAINQKQLDYPGKAAQFYEESLKIYSDLATKSPEVFVPFLASTYNSLGVLYTDLDNKEKGVEYYKKALVIYSELSDKAANEYLHYKATCLHNLGVIYDELKDYDEAFSYYQQALEIRKELVAKEEDSFTLDLCVTVMNMITLYHTKIEETKDLTLKKSAMELIDDVERRLMHVEDHLPVIKSMKSDVEYFKEFFSEVTY